MCQKICRARRIWYYLLAWRSCNRGHMDGIFEKGKIGAFLFANNRMCELTYNIIHFIM